MSTCKDCIHIDACGSILKSMISDVEIDTTYNASEKCPNFADKSLYIKLPCKVGTPVYTVDKVRNGHWEGNVYAVDDDGEWKVYETTFNLILFDIGGYYLTREEAEAALKEREK